MMLCSICLMVDQVDNQVDVMGTAAVAASSIESCISCRDLGEVAKGESISRSICLIKTIIVRAASFFTAQERSCAFSP